MNALSDLITLEKQSTINPDDCEIITDKIFDDIRICVLFNKDHEKYYYHKSQDGKVIQCFEMALSRCSYKDCYILDFTFDNIHRCWIDSRIPDTINISSLYDDEINIGMKCKYHIMEVEYESENSLKFNGKSIPVIPDTEYVFRIRKNKIYAKGGAKRLFGFLENIAVNENFNQSEEYKIGNFTMTSFEKGWWFTFEEKFAV